MAAGPKKTLSQLGQLHRLTRGAQAEMRTLLLELRPTAILEADMTTLLRQLVDSVQSRKRIVMSLQIEESGQLPPEVKVSLYRIAQEAVNNIIKHSDASEAFVHFNSQSDQVELVIGDNGKGFDLNQVTATSLGLKIMRERAEAVDAILTFASQDKQGTQITVVWNNPHKL